jgi:hypothetical protein
MKYIYIHSIMITINTINMLYIYDICNVYIYKYAYIWNAIPSSYTHRLVATSNTAVASVRGHDVLPLASSTLHEALLEGDDFQWHRNDQGMTGGPSFWWKFVVLCLSVGWSCHDLICVDMFLIWFDMVCFWLLCEFRSMLFGWFVCLLIILYTNFRWFILIYFCLMMAWWSWLVKSILVYSIPYVWND